MTNQSFPPPPPVKSGKGFSASQVIMMIVISMLLAMVVTVISIKLILFPGPFKPVELSAKEEQQLENKLQIIESFGQTSESTGSTNGDQFDSEGRLVPEKYSEEGAEREILFSERELNAMVAKNTDLAQKMAIDLAQDMISLKLLIPLDQDFPIMGGKTLRVTAGAELAYREGRPVVKLKGVSLMGIPMPNAWLGGLKNVDLVREYGGDEGFWQSFSDGVEAIAVVDGSIRIMLKE